MICPGNVLTFVCETRGSNSLAWESESYIGGIPVSFSRISSNEIKVINNNVSANLVMNYATNGVRVLRSVLNITVSKDIKNDIPHMITCVNVGHNTMESRTLQLAQDGMSLCNVGTCSCHVHVQMHHELSQA